MLIETKRLLLKDYSLENLQDYFALKSCDEVFKYSTNNPINSIEIANSQLKQLIENSEKDHIGFCAVYEKSSNSYIGEAGILSLNRTTERCVIGYNFLPAFWNKGYATEITKAVIEYAFCELKLERVEALAMELNIASCKVLEKSGLIKEGILRHFTKIDGSFYDVVYYGIIREIYESEMGYSVYHFCRIFYLYQGLTPMEYVLDRRLQAALAELNQGKKIIDVAFEFGFETPSGFTKAIKRKYGKTPSQLKRGAISGDFLLSTNNLIIHTETKEIEGFDICGYSIEVDFNSTNYLEGMIAYWTKFDEDEIEKQLYDSIDPYKHGEIGVLIRDANDTGKHKYLLGVMGNGKGQNNQWLDYYISGGKYVIITTPPVDMTLDENELASIVKKVWKYIFEQWFETVDFQFDEIREAFEYYDERCHYRKDAVMNIYIPIK